LIKVAALMQRQGTPGHLFLLVCRTPAGGQHGQGYSIVATWYTNPNHNLARAVLALNKRQQR
jgi:hypothetical protein